VVSGRRAAPKLARESGGNAIVGPLTPRAEALRILSASRFLQRLPGNPGSHATSDCPRRRATTPDCCLTPTIKQ
jgi:hypothetical protein